ncbi:hypothetical protein NCC78_28140 [Micromonospora phytophila]|uniref:hypothetical protein n=1 Tax=Micromonospora phytophila TaxID=709888 RepID=UPI00202FB6EF|nr:hypothetical protein [Micromonospora phytophila]MCM0678515.1 hypothetical protein [Micromonospora phytophila]
MTDAVTTESVTLHVYCRLTVNVTDPRALVDHAVADLRKADIDWAAEEDDLASAVAELRADLAAALGSVVDVGRMVEGLPGVAARGGLCWAEPGPPRDIVLRAR